jgi:hypothetical protein
MQMQNINLNIDSDIYDNIKRGGIDIQKKFNEFLSQFAFLDDGYPTIGTEEARKRVASAVENYKKNPEEFVPYSEGMDKIDKWLESL